MVASSTNFMETSKGQTPADRGLRQVRLRRR
jgi:hypothetical protein